MFNLFRKKTEPGKSNAKGTLLDVSSADEAELESMILSLDGKERATAWADLNRRTETAVCEIGGQKIVGRLLFIPLSLGLNYIPKSLGIDAHAIAKILIENGGCSETIEVAPHIQTESEIRNMSWPSGHGCLLEAMQRGIDDASIGMPNFDVDIDVATSGDGTVLISGAISVLVTSPFPQVPTINLERSTQIKIERSVALSLAELDEEIPCVFAGHAYGFVDAKLACAVHQLTHQAENISRHYEGCIMRVSPSHRTEVEINEHEWVLELQVGAEGQGRGRESLAEFSYVLRIAEEWKFLEMIKAHMDHLGIPVAVETSMTH